MSKTINQPVDFSGLILAFSSTALYYMGETTIEGKSNQQKNLPLARYNIDLINLLKEKTQGNLTPEENELIEKVSHDLMMKYSSIAP